MSNNGSKLDEQVQEKKLNTFEKFLPLWIGVCMVLGIFLSLVIPGIGEAINSWQIAGISVPIGICLFLMMYPAM
ncbi:MAG: arsenic resistance protein, partial [Candidatus Thorarchaeota archaeon]